MTDAQEKETPQPPRPRIITFSLVLLGFAMAILGAAGYAYHAAVQTSGLRTECLIAIAIAGAGATSCFAGIIYLVNLRLMPPALPGDAAIELPPWHVRVMLGELKRVLLLLQILTSALAVAALGLLIFGFKIPGG